MKIKNSESQFGLLAKLLHWLSALSIYFLFGLGLYMTELGYYDQWYHEAPDLHKSIGMILLFLTLFRFAWRWISPPPPSLSTQALEKRLASTVQYSFYLLIFMITISGYLISTAKGHPVVIFSLIEVPAVVTIESDIVEDMHELAAFTLVGLSILHIGAAIYHHFFLKDKTLRRML